MRSLILFFVFSTLALSVASQTIRVQPFLQDAEPDSIRVMWESTGGTTHELQWGTVENNLDQTVVASSTSSSGSNLINDAVISGISADTRYYYRVLTDNDTSLIYDFISPPLKSSDLSFNLVAMSDMQRDGSNPDKFDEIVHDGIIDYIEDEYGTDLPSHLAFVMIPGDLVVTGSNYNQWKDHFFDKAAPLFAQIPVYPVPGNHEQNSQYYFKYFHLPDNGSSGFEEHWWYKDYSNVRIIGIDSNGGYRNQTQLDWLSDVLDDACIDSDIDFVFLQLHHPHKSELWTPGEIGYTGQIIAIMEDFTDSCGKASIHFFGHTHGYSRGQSKNHQHLWVNAATAGGAIDYWGAFPNADYDEFTNSIDEYGFVVLNVEAGSDPQFTLKRISRGDESNTLDNVQQDSIVIKQNEAPPQKPSGIFPDGVTVNPDCVVLQASAFIDGGNLHQASQWKIFKGCEDLTTPLFESWKQHENWYDEVNTQADDDLTDEEFTQLDEELEYCWQVRYRDENLKWSEWSDATSFTTGTSGSTANLLLNPGGEDGVNDWTVEIGTIESLGPGECNGGSPRTGVKYLAVGGLCNGNETSYSEVYQNIDVSDFSTEIDNGNADAIFGGYLSNFSGSDQPTMQLKYLDDMDMEIASSEVLTSLNSSWTKVNATEQIPFSTRTLKVVLTGTRNAGTDNDCYFDDLSVKLDTVSGEECSQIVPLQLLEFTAKCGDDKIELKWKVSNEKNMDVYQIQERIEGKHWVTIDEIPATLQSKEIKDYSFKSWDFPRGQEVQYRIKMIEKGGYLNYSPTRVINCGSLDSKINAFPNPVSGGVFTISLENALPERTTIELSNFIGQVLFRKEILIKDPFEQFDVSVQDWKSGIYLINIKNQFQHFKKKIIKL